VMFSIDYPFENAKLATDWITVARLTETERQMVSHQNATRLPCLETTWPAHLCGKPARSRCWWWRRPPSWSAA
jgi:hypothetical protein